jgi:hypothetical protein
MRLGKRSTKGNLHAGQLRGYASIGIRLVCDPNLRSDPESREGDEFSRRDAVAGGLRSGVQHARRKARRRGPSAAAELHVRQHVIARIVPHYLHRVASNRRESPNEIDVRRPARAHVRGIH